MLAKKAAPSGAPEWVLTYGDMMSLLLCFFILLAAFADYEKGGSSEQMVAAMQSIKESLGIPSTGDKQEGVVAFNALVQQIKMALEKRQEPNRSDTPDRGLRGREFRLRRIREGLEIIIGGPVVFEPFSDQITDSARETLKGLAGTLKGHRNMLEVRGHAGDAPRPEGWTETDAMELSYRRARSVMRELMACGVDPRTLRLVAAGGTEPVVKNFAPLMKEGQNRRVEIIVRESLLEDFATATPKAPTTQAG